MECGCVCVWDGIFGGDMLCGALSANLRVTTEKEGSVFVLHVCHFLAREWHVPLFPSFSSFLFRVLCINRDD